MLTHFDSFGLISTHFDSLRLIRTHFRRGSRRKSLVETDPSTITSVVSALQSSRRRKSLLPDDDEDGAKTAGALLSALSRSR